MEKAKSDVIQLLHAPKNTPMEIVSLEGGKNMHQKLTAMGLTHHTVVRVLHGGEKGPMVVEVRGSRVGLGQRISSKIMVRPFFSNEIKPA